jgi:CBS domain containing-hemolysin-like protein
VGDEVRVDGLVLRVLEIDGSRIGKIEVEFGADGGTPTDEHAAA